MRLLKLEIEGLYGHYDYDVDFNKDVTFLYGGNGSGKTTILTIITYIIRGEIYKLFEYEFDFIRLTYLDEEENQIWVRRKDQAVDEKEEDSFGFFKKSYYEKSSVLEFSYLGNLYSIREAEILSISNRYDGYDFKIRLFDMYPVFSEISDKFNYIYLPLGRASMDKGVVRSSLDYKKIGKIDGREYIVDEVDSLHIVEGMIRQEINRVNSGQAKIMDNFRDNILRDLTDLNKLNLLYMDVDVDRYLMNFDREEDEINAIGRDYLDILGKLDIYSYDERKEIMEFFYRIGEFKSRIDRDRISDEDKWKLALSYNELNRIEKVLDLSKEMEREKEKLSERIGKYLATINDFLGSTYEKKYATIKDDGLYFYVSDTDSYINITRLSSGEKQIVIFFANLILNMQENSSGIFMVDEPEISLHLAWQNIYVDKILDLAQDIQLIFATHSPEIIGRHYDKVLKLDKKIES